MFVYLLNNYANNTDNKKITNILKLVCVNNFIYSFLDYSLVNHGAHMLNGGNIQCNSCKKKYKSEKTLFNHKCSWCPCCHHEYSSFQKLKQHRCKDQSSLRNVGIKEIPLIQTKDDPIQPSIKYVIKPVN